MRNHKDCGKSPNPRLGLEEAFDRYCRRRWRRSTAACICDEFGLSNNEARELLRRRISKSVIDKIFGHRNGGWPVIDEVLSLAYGSRRDYQAERREAAWRELETFAEDAFPIGGRG